MLFGLSSLPTRRLWGPLPEGMGSGPVRKNAAQGDTGRTDGYLLPVLVAQIMVGLYMVGLFKNVF